MLNVIKMNAVAKKSVQDTNTLAYFSGPTMKNKESFQALSPDVLVDRVGVEPHLLHRRKLSLAPSAREHLAHLGTIL